MIMETPTAVLRTEHQLILRVVEAFEDDVNAIAVGDGMDRQFDAVSDCIAFFRLFIDACHHGKEEDLLFPELEANGMSSQGGPIAVMLMEHEQGRRIVRAMAGLLVEARGGDADAVRKLVRHGRQYIDFIRAHIDKEDGVLFHIADGLVPDSRCTRLCEAYHDADECAFESRSKNQLEALAARIIEGRD